MYIKLSSTNNLTEPRPTIIILVRLVATNLINLFVLIELEGWWI